MKTFQIAMAGLLAVTLSMVAGVAADNDHDRDDRGTRIHATLVGFNEVPSVSTQARGRFRAVISSDASGEQQIEYSLSYSGLSSAVQQAHIHFAQQHTNGAVVLFLCQGAVLAPATVPTPPTCPQEGTVTGTLKAANVLPSPPAQQIAAGEFAEVIAAIRAGAAYANVHSAISGGGEIRGQIRVDDDHRN